MKLWTPKQKLKNGRLIIQKVLGAGGFGITYSALDLSKGKLVVIKTLNHIQQTKIDFEARQVKFVNEALRLAKCSHPHIVQVYEVIQEDGLWGMVMEYIDGQDLAVYINECEIISEKEALGYIEQVGEALEYVHQQGFLHRDIKPSNIILHRDTKEAILIDFGLAREYLLGEMGTMTNDITLGYAPPEQYERRGNFGSYTDVYALAATLYSLLTTKIPVPAHFRNQGIPLPPPKQFNPQISNWVNDAIIKGMELESDQRPQSVREFRELLNIINTPSPQPQKTTIIPNSPFQKKVRSGVKVEYSQLESLLTQMKWREANEETLRVMLLVADRVEMGWLRVEDIDQFPCVELRSIDQLWVNYSQGRFGFSVQRNIHQNLGGTRRYDKDVWAVFVNTVGWKKENYWIDYGDLIFDITAPPAHLPFVWVKGVENWAFVGVWLAFLTGKLLKCNI